MRFRVLAIVSVLAVWGVAAAGDSGGKILVSPTASEIERYAAHELQRYLYRVSGRLLPTAPDTEAPHGPVFIVGSSEAPGLIRSLRHNGRITVSPEDPGPQGYVLKRLDLDGHPALAIVGSDPVGCLYGVYGLLDDHYEIGFYLGGDVLPERSPILGIPDIDERNAPEMHVRGILPWTNFPQSATVYSWEDWRFVIDQMAKMRMNFLHIHNYNFGDERGHNELFHNFTYRGILSRGWMATARSGHLWAGPGWRIEDYLFGAEDLFDDYDFGSDCALHNENLTNQAVFGKGVALFQKVIAYAHSRGVRMGLGLDINLIPAVYGADPDDPEVIRARVDQIVRDYPDLDYLICFQSEDLHVHEGGADRWRRTFDGFYSEMKARQPSTRLAVAGWGIRPDHVETLPEDVICAPIAPYTASFEDGRVYGDREYWGCPWMERDFNSSEYYYPYNIHLSDTIEGYRNRAPNMKGFYTLSWRLTDAVDAKMAYVAKAPWDRRDRYTSSEAVYREYAVRNYGGDCADDITAIINENEPVASLFGECEATPSFTGSFIPSGSGYLLNISRFRFVDEEGRGQETAAADFTGQQGIQTADCSEGGLCVGFIEHNDWLFFDDYDFGAGAVRFEARVASATAGGTIVIRLDHPLSGEVLAAVPVTATGNWQAWETVNVPVAPPVRGVRKLYLLFQGVEINELPKAEEQLATVRRWIERTQAPGPKARLELLYRRLAAARDHIVLNRHFPTLPWEELPGAFDSWARNFTHRVTDISSLGNVQSTQNRFVQLNYLPRERELREGQAVKAPSYVKARGTREGAVLTWRNEHDGVQGFNVYRDGDKRNETPVTDLGFTDTGDGEFEYRVTAVAADGSESPRSVPARCQAGRADRVPPHVVVVSPPVSHPAGTPAPVKARLLDGRVYDLLSATLVYRAPGQSDWARVPMDRRTRGVFAGHLPGDAIGDLGLEYYVEASDGDLTTVYPAGAPAQPLSLVATPRAGTPPPQAPTQARAADVDGKPGLAWDAVEGAHIYRIYRIYRSDDAACAPGPATFLTYVAGETTAFADNGLDFDAAPLRGTRYYRVTAVDAGDREGAPSECVAIGLED